MSLIAFIGRILLGAFFIYSGSNHLKNKKGMIAYAKSKHAWKPDFSVPFTGFMLVISGITIILGLPFAWFAKAFLVPYLIVVNIVMHAFWKEKGEAKDKEMLSFMYNLALIGSLLIIF